MESPVVVEREVVGQQGVQQQPQQPTQHVFGCTNDDTKRLKVLEELMATEQQYIKDLHVLIRGYLVPLRHSMIVSESDVDQLACNIHAIEDLHKSLFSDMEQIVEKNKHDPTHPLSYFFVLYFEDIAEKLKLYSTYARYHFLLFLTFLVPFSVFPSSLPLNNVIAYAPINIM